MIAYLYGGPRNGERFEVAPHLQEIYVPERLEAKAYPIEETTVMYEIPRVGVYRRSLYYPHEYYWEGWK